jgi:hypothetical protein
MQSAALVVELRSGRPVFPMLEVAWEAKGFSLGTERYARGGAILADGRPCKGLVPNAGFRECAYGPGMKGNTLVAARTSVKLNDTDGSIQSMLETYDPRGSAATVRWVSPSLVEADWEPIFTGLVDDWRTVDSTVELLLKTNDAPLNSPGPKPIFSRAEWGYAFDATTWGTAMPLVMGIHDSYKVTGRGMVPAVNIKWNTDLGLYWWCASLGNLKSIPRIYYDGEPKELGFGVLRGVYGGAFQTIITADAANAPQDDTGSPNGGAIVSFDCTGPAADGTTSGPALTNPLAELRAFLNNYTFRDNRTGVWSGDAQQIHAATWDYAETLFDLYGYEGAFRIGGGEREPSLRVVEAFLKARPWFKMWWTPSGQIAVGVIEHGDPNVSPSDWLNASTKVEPKEFVYAPGDRKDIKSGIIQPYLYSHSEQKYLGSYEAHDLSVLPAEERVTDEIEDEFSQGRYDQDT